MNTKKGTLILKGDSLIKISMFMLITICFSNCTALRYFEPHMWSLIIIFLLLTIRGKSLNSIHLILFAFIAFLGMNIIVSYDSRITMGYLKVFIVGLLFSMVVNDEEIYIKFKRLCFMISLFIAITILIELFNNKFCAEYLWFLGEVSKSKMGVQAINKANEIAYGAYSGVAFEKADAAYYMNIGIACILAKYCAIKKMRKLDGILLIIYMIALLLTGKRMLFLIAIFASLFLFLISGIRNKGQKMLFIIVVTLGLFILAASIFPELMTTFERLSMSSGEDDAMLERYVKWYYALQLFKLHPAIGVGYGTYNGACSTVGYKAIYYAHNVYVQMLAEVGIIGTVILITYIILNLLITSRYIWKNKDSNVSRHNELTFFSLYMQVLVIIYGLSGNVLYYKSQLIMYLIVTGMTCCVIKNTKGIE